MIADAGDLGAFTVDLSKAMAKVGEKLDLFVKGFTQTVFNEIQTGGRYSPGTPVDTGFARANWVGGIGATPPAPALERVNIPGAHSAEIAAATQQLTAVALSAKMGDAIVLVNGAPYINRLEFGHSGQAPHGMIRLALQNAQAIADEVAAHVARM